MGAAASTLNDTEIKIYEKIIALNNNVVEELSTEGLNTFTGSDKFTIDSRQKFLDLLERLKVIHLNNVQTYYQNSVKAEVSFDTLGQSVTDKFELMLRQEKELLLDLGKHKAKGLLVVLEESILKVKCFDYLTMKQTPSDVTILSYRWNEPAVAFQKKFNWAEALVALAISGEYVVNIPSDEASLLFYSSLVKIFERTGIKSLWVDQMCIPQDMPPYTMAIVLACGSFYKEFEVLVWVPWVLLSDAELEVYRKKVEDAEERRDDRYIVEVVGKDISFLHNQSNRGWILREMSSACKAVPSERSRNGIFLSDLYRILAKTVERHEKKMLSKSQVGMEVASIVTMILSLKNLIFDMDGKPEPSMHLRLCMAPFTVPTDRSIVALLEGYHVAGHISSNNSKGVNISNATSEQKMLSMFTYLGCKAFLQNKLWSDWSCYDYDQQSSKLLIDYFLTESIPLFEDQFKQLDMILQTGQFTCYRRYSGALEDSSYGGTERHCHIRLKNGSCLIQGYASTRLGIRNGGILIGISTIEAGNLKPLLTALKAGKEVYVGVGCNLKPKSSTSCTLS